MYKLWNIIGVEVEYRNGLTYTIFFKTPELPFGKKKYISSHILLDKVNIKFNKKFFVGVNKKNS